MSYWRRACRLAWATTETYSLKKAVPSVLAALIQAARSTGSAQSRILVSAAVIAAAYALLSVAEFVWKALISAPVTLDAEQEHENRQLKSEIETLKAKPTWTPAEQYHLDAARRSLGKLGQQARDVLLYLHNHQALTFSSYNPMMPPPQGMQWGDVRQVLVLLMGEELVTVSHTRTRGDMEYTYTIAPAKIAVLQQLLYESKS